MPMGSSYVMTTMSVTRGKKELYGARLHQPSCKAVPPTQSDILKALAAVKRKATVKYDMKIVEIGAAVRVSCVSMPVLCAFQCHDDDVL